MSRATRSWSITPAHRRRRRGPINATLGVTWSATFNAFLHLTDPTIPKNSGCFRPIKIVAPPGTIVNVDYPGPEVGGNTETHPRIAGAVIGAMAPVIPQRAMAAEGSTHINFVFGGHDEANDEYFACYDIEMVGWGARISADGNDAQELDQRQLPRDAGRSVRNALPMAGRGVDVAAGFRRRRKVPRRARHRQAHAMPQHDDHGEPDDRPPSDQAVGLVRRQGGRQRRDADPAGRQQATG